MLRSATPYRRPLPAREMPNLLWQALSSSGELQDLAHLRGAIDASRVAGDPGGAHRLLGDLLEAVASDLHRTEASRHSEPGDEGIEQGPGVAAWLRHRQGDLCLPIRIHRLVPAHNRRQHNAGRVPMRYVEFGTKHVADAVARSHWHPAGERAHGEPSADLAFKSCCQVLRRGLDPRQ